MALPVDAMSNLQKSGVPRGRRNSLVPEAGREHPTAGEVKTVRKRKGAVTDPETIVRAESGRGEERKLREALRVTDAADRFTAWSPSRRHSVSAPQTRPALSVHG